MRFVSLPAIVFHGEKLETPLFDQLRRFQVRKSRGIVFFMSFVCVAMFGCFACAQAAEAQKPAQPYRAGVVDLEDLLRAHPKLNADIKNLQENAKAIQANALAQTQKLQEEGKVLQSMKPGSVEFIAKNDELVKKMSDLEGEKARAFRDLQINNLRIVYSAYRSIQAEIETLAVQYGFAIVINNKTIDPKSEDPTLAEFAISQSVVWNYSNVDLTNFIIKALNAKYGKDYQVVCTIGPNNERTFSNAGAAGLGAPPRATAADGTGAAAPTATARPGTAAPTTARPGTTAPR